jgi:hypothetical protein
MLKCTEMQLKRVGDEKKIAFAKHANALQTLPQTFPQPIAEIFFKSTRHAT